MADPTPETLRCAHEQFRADVHVIRIAAPVPRGFEGRLAVNVTVHCEECELPVHFIGLPFGMLYDGASVSIDMREGRLIGVVNPYE